MNRKQQKESVLYDIMELELDVLLLLVSNSITLWTNVICDMIEHPERVVYQDLFRGFCRVIFRHA